jgi:hypothetical protein
MGKDLALYLGAFMVCTVILIIPGVIFLLFWAVTRNDDKEQYVEHHHHYNNRKTLNIHAPNGVHTMEEQRKFDGYIDNSDMK